MRQGCLTQTAILLAPIFLGVRCASPVEDGVTPDTVTPSPTVLSSSSSTCTSTTTDLEVYASTVNESSMDYVFHNLANPVAQSFTVTSSRRLWGIGLMLQQSGGGGATSVATEVSLYKGNTNAPNFNQATTGTKIRTISLDLVINYTLFQFSDPPLLEPGNTYWIYVSPAATINTWYATGNAYAGGTALGYENGSWTATPTYAGAAMNDLLFKVILCR